MEVDLRGFNGISEQIVATDGYFTTVRLRSETQRVFTIWIFLSMLSDQLKEQPSSTKLTDEDCNERPLSANPIIMKEDLILYFRSRWFLKYIRSGSHCRLRVFINYRSKFISSADEKQSLIQFNPGVFVPFSFPL